MVLGMLAVSECLGSTAVARMHFPRPVKETTWETLICQESL